MTLPDPPPYGAAPTVEHGLPTPVPGSGASGQPASTAVISTPMPPPPPPRPPWLDDPQLAPAAGRAAGAPMPPLLPSRPLGQVILHPPVSDGARTTPHASSSSVAASTGHGSAFAPPIADRAIAPVADPTSVPPPGSHSPDGRSPDSIESAEPPTAYATPASPVPTSSTFPSEDGVAGTRPVRRRGSGRLTTVALAGTAPVVITAGLLAALSSGSTAARLISVIVALVLTFVLMRALLGPSAASILQVVRWIGRTPGEPSEPPASNPEATNEVAALLDAVRALTGFAVTDGVRPGTPAPGQPFGTPVASSGRGLTDASTATAIRRSCQESHRELDVLFDQPTAPEALRSLINADHLVSIALHRATVDLVLRGDVLHAESLDERPEVEQPNSPDAIQASSIQASSVQASSIQGGAEDPHVPLDDIVRRAVGSVSKYQRIDIGFVDPLSSFGEHAERLALLLTEVLELAMSTLPDTQRITIGTDLVDDQIYIVIAGLSSSIAADSAAITTLAELLGVGIENYADGDDVTMELHVPEQLLVDLIDDDPIAAAARRSAYGVRPNAMTGGRFRPSRSVAPTSMITLSSRREAIDDFRWEAAALMHAADRPRRLAELAAAAHVPFTVAEIIVADLIASGSLVATERRTRSTARSQLEAALSG